MNVTALSFGHTQCKYVLYIHYKLCSLLKEVAFGEEVSTLGIESMKHVM